MALTERSVARPTAWLGSVSVRVRVMSPPSQKIFSSVKRTFSLLLRATTSHCRRYRQAQVRFWFSRFEFVCYCNTELQCQNICQCFDTVGWASGRLVKWSDEVLVWLSVWSEGQVVYIWSSWCHCIPKPYHLLLHLNPDWFYLSCTGLRRLSYKRGC